MAVFGVNIMLGRRLNILGNNDFLGGYWLEIREESGKDNFFREYLLQIWEEIVGCVDLSDYLYNVWVIQIFILFVMCHVCPEIVYDI
jgi:hypothetical protein